MQRFTLFALTAMLVIFGTVAFALLHHENNLSMRVKFNLVNQHSIKTTEEDFRGNWLLIYFGFTNCAKVCPMQMSVMTKVLQELDKTRHSTVLTPILITVDPERDTPEVMNNYVAHFDDRIFGLTGSEQEIQKVIKEFSALSVQTQKSDGLNYDVIHPDFFYLISPDGKLNQRYASKQSSAQLASNIRNKIQKDMEIL